MYIVKNQIIIVYFIALDVMRYNHGPVVLGNNIYIVFNCFVFVTEIVSTLSVGCQLRSHNKRCVFLMRLLGRHSLQGRPYPRESKKAIHSINKFSTYLQGYF